MNGVDVGTISHVQRGVNGKCGYVERMDRAIVPVITTGIRTETLRDVLTEENNNKIPSVVRPQEIIGC